MRVAGIEFHQKFVRIQTGSNGLTNPKEICDFLLGGATAQEIGASVLRALSASRSGIPREEYQALVKGGGLSQYAASIDVKTMAEFGFTKKRDMYSGMVACEVSEKDGTISFQTMLHVGMENYKYKTGDYVNPIPLVSGEEAIGFAVKAAAFDI